MAVREIESRSLDFERNGLTLHGTLTLPMTDGTYLPPVFVLVHGSGPNDRNSTTRGALGVAYGEDVPTFRLLAEGLAHAGAAVYRYDKRTCFWENSEGRCPNRFSDYPGDIDAVLIDDYIDDLRTAVRTVAALPDVDGDDITVVGLSQGANFVPLLVADEPGVVAGVQLAGSSLPIDEVTVEQIREFADELEADGYPEETVAGLRAEADTYEAGLGEIRTGTFAGSHFNGTPVDHWLNWMERTDHLREEFVAVDKPLLLLHGDLDLNVRVSHLERFKAWATEAGMQNVSSLLIPGATHNFVLLDSEGTRIEAWLAPQAIEAITDWHR